jgi:trigger factor
VKVDVEELGSCKRRLAVEAPTDVVQAAWEDAYGRVRKQARLPGFRRGHVPRNLVKLHFADDVRREVVQHLLPEVYREALTRAQIAPLDDPEFTDVTLEEGTPLTFKATVEVRPVVALGAYKGVPVTYAPMEPSATELEETLNRMRESQAEYRAVERAPAPGDLIIIDYTLTPDGMPPVEERGYTFVVGDGSVMPEIDEAVVLMTPGIARTVGVRFPADHRREELRGRAGTATVSLIEVKEKVLPPLDDDFARSVGAYETLDALRAEVEKQLAARREREDRHRLEDAVVDAVLAQHELAVPNILVLRQIAHVIESTRERMRRQGVDPERLPWDYEKLAADLRPGAERAVRRALLLDAVAEAEALEPSEADVEAEIERIATAAERTPAAIRGMMEKSGDLAALRQRLREARTLDFLIQHASISS